ncbi:NarK family nitrate/nitrite MFS transporter [Isoptericola halotolerans]|uniref:NNP family nitrate/nitrite transporter-like MFS transporter n=1 Tax=Isoptericola halotolerans TaxID=300560 RepID=A0ABX2A4H2_9MICO|nr:MFS transporter [Isoptericola halotolerans]NOV97752.1 NNP family nitrate/nitrite transporter-like MFS transporter [Isoptericola halotolerans]
MVAPTSGTASSDAAPTSAATTTAEATGPAGTDAPPRRPVHRSGRWIDHWDPEDPVFWRDGGRRIARRNLVVSIFAEFLGFCVWAIWSIVVPQLPAAGFALTADQMFWLIGVPALVGATLRIPYTLAVPVFGGRNWTVISAALLLIPTLSLAFIVQRPETSFGVLLLVAALAGLGGGNFASSMANISFFFPEKEKGAALGWNAAGGNLGTAVVQFVVPLVIVTAAGISLERAGLVFVPFILLAVILSWRLMDNLGTAKADPRSFGAAVREKHTWIISFIYIGTFGSFVGFAGVFPTLLAGQFPEVTLSLAFMGALVGSVARPVGGIIADRLGGAVVTVASFAVMIIGAVGAIQALGTGSFALFFGSFMLLFVATGIGNGSVYRMIPIAFRVARGGGAATAKAAAGCIGVAGAVGAFGGFLIPRGFAMSTTATGSLVPALWVFVGAYVVMAAVTWFVYGRRSGVMGAARV